MLVARKRYIILSIFLAGAILFLDQTSKFAILNRLAGATPASISITSFFDLVLVWNTGISFGMFAQHQPHILVAVSLVIIFILLIWLYKHPYLLNALALGLVMGGAVGNVIDRLRFGAVVDFLDFHLGTHHWPAFNIADSTIFIGVVLLASRSMLTSTRSTL